MDEGTLTHGGVTTRSKEKAQERDKRVQAIKEASKGVLTRSKDKEKEEEIHQANKTIRTLRISRYSLERVKQPCTHIIASFGVNYL